MGYGYKFVRNPDGTFASFAHVETQGLLREGKIKEELDGYHFARDIIPAQIPDRSSACASKVFVTSLPKSADIQ